MRFHIPGIPHTKMNDDFSNCAFTTNSMNLCKMLVNGGHEVIQYAAEGSDVLGTKFVEILSDKEFQKEQIVEQLIRYRDNKPDSRIELINKRINKAMLNEIQKNDFICAYMGTDTRYEFKDCFTVETGIGYINTFSSYRVFPSLAWQHWHHGKEMFTNGLYKPKRWKEIVIPHPYDPGMFKPRYQDEIYLAANERPLLYLGRCVWDKGIEIAIKIAKELNKDLIIAGSLTQVNGSIDEQFQNWINEYNRATYIGEVNAEKRAILLRDAECLISPTLYDEPFGLVLIESLASGTPIITSDWGACTEIVKQGVNGYRCRNFTEFVNNVKKASLLNRQIIEKSAYENYAIKNILKKYEYYFESIINESKKSHWWSV